MQRLVGVDGLLFIGWLSVRAAVAALYEFDPDLRGRDAANVRLTLGVDWWPR